MRNKRLSKVQDWESIAVRANFQPARMAAICSVSLRQLERFFRDHFKQMPRDWVRELRCRLAHHRFEEGFTNKAVTTDLHFGNASQLCHDFKRYYGISPQTTGPRRLSCVRKAPPRALEQLSKPS